MADPKIQFRRSVEADRADETPAQGEPRWTTDQHRLFAGDNSTAGGLYVGPTGIITLRRAATLALSGVTNLDWDTQVIVDTDFTHDTGTNPYEITIVPACRLKLSASVSLDCDGSAKVRGAFYFDDGGGYAALNSTLFYGTAVDATVDFAQITMMTCAAFTAGDKLKVILQLQGGSATTATVAANGATLVLERIL
jgi:hypothetical protein